VAINDALPLKPTDVMPLPS